MTNEDKGQEVPQQTIPPGDPICPYCGQDPAIVAARPFSIGPQVHAVVIYCLKCRKIFNIHVLQIAQPRIIRPQ